MVIGDTHFTAPDFPYAEKLSIVAGDLDRMIGRGRLDALVQVGDNVSAGTQVEYDAYFDWRSNILNLDGLPFGEVPGNHELMGNGGAGIGGVPDIRTPSQWAALVGQRGKSGSLKDSYLDVGRHVRILLVAPQQDSSTGIAATRRLSLDPATLAWCGQRMAEVPDRQCLIVFHAPLENTLGPVIPTYNTNSSFDEVWRAHYETGSTIAQTLSQHPNFVAWISGHAHARIDAERLVVPVTYGDVTFAHVAASSPAIWHWNAGLRTSPPVCPLVSIYADRVEVRYRSHGMGQWLDPVYTVVL